MTWDLKNLFLHLERLDDIGCCKFRGVFNKSYVTSSVSFFNRNVVNLSTSCNSDLFHLEDENLSATPPWAAPAVFLSSTGITASKPITAALGFCWFRAHEKKPGKTTPCCCKNYFLKDCDLFLQENIYNMGSHFPTREIHGVLRAHSARLAGPFSTSLK